MGGPSIEGLAVGQSHWKIRTVTIRTGQQYWHSIDIVDEHVVKNAMEETIVKAWFGRGVRKLMYGIRKRGLKTESCAGEEWRRLLKHT